MVGGTWSQSFQVIGVIAALAGTAALRPALAEAQARGTLQVSAQVVDLKPGYDGLQLARAALGSGPAGSVSAEPHAVPTLAHVSVAYATAQRPVLVVTVDYSRN
jgi:hypothetical protein